MIYATAKDYLAATQKRVMLFGMSGLGKTYLSNMLRDAGGWFHYSVDYRIGTRYMNEFIADNFKREAMKVPLLRELLLSDSVYISSNITFDNLQMWVLCPSAVAQLLRSTGEGTNMITCVEQTGNKACSDISGCAGDKNWFRLFICHVLFPCNKLPF